MARGNPSVTDRRQQSLFIFHAQFLTEPGDFAFIAQGGIVELIAMQIAVENFPSQEHTSITLLSLQPGAKFRFGARRLYPFEPVAARRLLLRGDNLDGVAAAQNVFERYQLTVDARAGTTIPDFGVNAIGKIDHRGALGKAQQISFGREHVERSGEQILLEAVQKLLRILQVFLPFEQLSKPGESLNVADLKILAVFVAPVGGDSFLGDPMHFMGANLNLDALAIRPEHTGMQ